MRLEREAAEAAMEMRAKYGEVGCNPATCNNFMEVEIIQGKNLIVLKTLEEFFVKAGALVQVKLPGGALRGFRPEHVCNTNLLLKPKVCFWQQKYEGGETGVEIWALYLHNQVTLRYSEHEDVVICVRNKQEMRDSLARSVERDVSGLAEAVSQPEKALTRKVISAEREGKDDVIIKKPRGESPGRASK